VRTVALADLTDSKILYDKRPPLFGFIVIGLALLMVIAAVVWASVTVKPSVVQGAGTVQGANRALIMSNVSGQVLEVRTPNGAEVAQGDVMIVIDSPELAVERELLQAQQESLEASLALQQQYTAAIEAGDNAFDPTVPEEALFFHQLKSLEKQIAQLQVDRPSMEAIGYTSVEIDNAIQTNKLKKDELTSTALSSSTERESELRHQIDEFGIQLAAVEKGGEAFSVSAAASGQVYLNESVKSGTVLSAGESIGSIASADQGLSIRVLLAVPDRQYVRVGDPVKVSVTGLPDVEYGNLSGAVSSIDSDVTTIPAADGGASGSNFFVAEVAVERDYVETREGAEHRLVNGTAVDAEFVYDEVTYLEHIAQMFGLTA
jgi:multidrug resistance efflux pump